MDIEKFWSPFETQINSFDELVAVIGKVMKKSVEKKIQFAWRGQVDAGWPLHSSLYRRIGLTEGFTPDEEKFSKVEHEILVELHKWGLHSTNHSGRLSILNQLAILQHYGAPTRLVDISFNAWVGAWFAVEEKWSNGSVTHEEVDARLFAIDVSGRLINEIENMRQWEDDLHRPWGRNGTAPIDKKEWTTNVFAWRPPSLDARISAQNGGFLFGGVAGSQKPDGNTFQFPKGTPNKSWWPLNEGRQACCLALRPHKFEPSHGGISSGALYTFRIDAKAKGEIRSCLEKMFGYQHRTIYPDYTGFASFGTPKLKRW